MSPRTITTRAASLAALLVLGGCGSVEIAPEPAIPKPLVRQMPVRAAVLVTGEQRNYRHTETRSGVDWLVVLGAGHLRLAHEVFGALFADPRFFDDVDAARDATGLAVIFEPRMEQYSFATANETGGDYYAVTIRYRINVYAQGMKLVDSYTITGYGSGRDQAVSSSKPLEIATRAAMRDAAAKFLVQFPRQPVAQQLARGEALVAPAAVVAEGGAPTEAMKRIEAVPVIDPPQGAPAPVPAQPPPAPVPAGAPPPQSQLRSAAG